MTKSIKVLLALNAVLLLWNLAGATVNAQRPPAVNVDGTPFLPVNINPTDVPPMVNVNPNGEPARVDVVRIPDLRLPDVRVIPSGCDFRDNYQTAIGRAIAGPITLTYLNVTSQTQAMLVSAAGNQRVVFSNSAALASAMYLRAGQQLTFDNDVMYSGCRPQ